MPSLMDLSQRKSRLLTPRVLLLAFSLISLVICSWAAAAHYRKLAWGDPWQPIGWLLSMFFLLCAFLPDPRGLATSFKSLVEPKTAFFLFWILFLLVDLFFGSYIITSVTALSFNFFPFAFIYTFVGYRYPMTVALAVVSLYFLHAGFRNSSPFCLSLGGIAAGLCLASSIPGKQYVLALVIAAPLYAVSYWKSLKRTVTWSSLALIVYGFLAAATPILCYIIFNRDSYTYYECTYIRDFWHALRGIPAPHDMRYYVTGLWNCFFAAHFWPRLLFP